MALSLNDSQRQIARRIVEVGRARSAPAKHQRAALAAAWVEDRFRHRLVALDHDSIGVFQQRPSVGEWGTKAQISNLDFAINSFYKAALKYDRDNISPGELAARVQRPRADLRYKYGAIMPETDKLLEQLTGAGAGDVYTLPAISGGVTPPVSQNVIAIVLGSATLAALFIVTSGRSKR